MKALINKKYQLEKFPGKGGWTYARIPEILKDKQAPFGWVCVKGTIDGVEIKKYNLMPMGNNNLFLPVKAALRKKIKKQEGDMVHIILYRDNDTLEVPDEFLSCLEDEPAALEFFNSLTNSQKKYYTSWVYAARQESTRVSRLAISVQRLAQKKKFHDPAAEK